MPATYAVAVLAPEAAIGVDLESMSRKADIERLGVRVFSESEQALVRAGGREAFFTLWSQKESLLKALGCGWADGRIVRRTKLECIPDQVEPATGVRVWSRPVLGRRLCAGRRPRRPRPDVAGNGRRKFPHRGNFFPMVWKIWPIFSTVWKHFFHCVENPRNILPLYGKNGLFFPQCGYFFSTLWKNPSGV